MLIVTSDFHTFKSIKENDSAIKNPSVVSDPTQKPIGLERMHRNKIRYNSPMGCHDTPSTAKQNACQWITRSNAHGKRFSLGRVSNSDDPKECRRLAHLELRVDATQSTVQWVSNLTKLYLRMMLCTKKWYFTHVTFLLDNDPNHDQSMGKNHKGDRESTVQLFPMDRNDRETKMKK